MQGWSSCREQRRHWVPVLLCKQLPQSQEQMREQQVQSACGTAAHALMLFSGVAPEPSRASGRVLGNSSGSTAGSCLDPSSPACWQHPGPSSALPGCLPDSTLGVPNPSLWLWLRAHTHHAPVGDTQVFGLPWHTSDDLGSPTRGWEVIHHKDCGSRPELSGEQAGHGESSLCSCGPLHPETPAHYLFSLPQEVSL